MKQFDPLRKVRYRCDECRVSGDLDCVRSDGELEAGGVLVLCVLHQHDSVDILGGFMATKKKSVPRAKRVKNVGYLTARVYDSKSTSILVKVPVMMTTIPEVPEVILVKNWAATLFSTNPLAYRTVTTGWAKLI
jgi:hypothetical protein